MSVMPASAVHYHYLMPYRRGTPNDPLIAQMYASWMAHDSALPDYLGLDHDAFCHMMQYHFPTLPTLSIPTPAVTIPSERLPELDDLQILLQQHQNPDDCSSAWLQTIVCAACMGSNHLWQDLGLWSRQGLSQLMTHNFPTLAAKNHKDMKWKKFLYKQLCEAEGIYVCRSPSCEVCADYSVCFGPED